MSAVRFRAAAFGLPYDDEPYAPTGLRLTGDGRLATVTDAAAIRQALLLLLSTRPGERVNRPDYGCHLSRLAFAPADDTTAGLAVHYVGQAVRTWEKRVDVLALDARQAPDEPWLLEIRMRYRIRASQHDDDLTLAVPVDAGGRS